MLQAFAKAHDGLTKFGFQLAKLCLVVIVSSYTYETVARYFFSAPTWWSNEVVGYALCIGVFLAMPELTRRKGHIAITFTLESLPPSAANRLSVVLNLISGLVCLLVAWMSLQENIRQIANDVMLVRVEPIPKIWISIWITYGFLSSGIYFLRHTARSPANTDDGAADLRV
jgi:TRAP-type C4-dicarboxylate transport system permease small subunit